MINATPWLLLTIIVATLPTAAAAATENLLTVEADWTTHSFAGESRYQWLRDQDGEYVCGKAPGTASLWLRRINVDLDKNPLLTWRWRAPRSIPGLDQEAKAGDDFPARIYVVARKGLRPRTLVYIWAHSAADQPWPNPFDSNTIMIPLLHGASEIWQRARADVRADLARHFDLHAPAELGIGFMTDGDNSGETLSGCYRDLIFRPVSETQGVQTK